jgi:hypothetical protein
LGSISSTWDSSAQPADARRLWARRTSRPGRVRPRHPEFDADAAAEYKEKIVGVLVLVPDEFTFQLDDHQIVAVELSDDAGLPVVRKRESLSVRLIACIVMIRSKPAVPRRGHDNASRLRCILPEAIFGRLSMRRDSL